MIGYDSAFIGTTISLASFKNEFKLDLTHKTAAEFSTISANIVSLYQSGAFFGSLGAYFAGNILGRKWGLLISSLVFTLGAGIMLAADGSRGLGPIYAGRVLAGLGIGAASNLTPLYISEISPPAIRGQMVGMYEIAWQIGGLVGFWINYGITEHIPSSRKQWIIPFAIQLIPGGLFAIGIPLILRESPRWLIQRNRRDEAVKNLCFLRNLDQNDPYIIDEINLIDIQVAHDRTAVGDGFFAPIKMASRAAPTHAVNYYSPTIFKSLGITGSNTGLLTTGVFGVMKTVASLIWAFLLIDNFGRRDILIVGALGGSISMFWNFMIARFTPQMFSSMGYGEF
ncbi:hypothetical protein RQP46_001097 [Phenoliferia psychrophenolica]